VAESTRQDFDGLFSLYLVVGAAVALVVLAAVAFVLIRYRAREGRTPSTRSEAHALEIGAAILITAIIAFLVFRTFSTEAKEDDASTAAVRIDVTAFQWGWRFTYPGEGVSVVGNSNRPPTFAVPGNRPIAFSLRSADVIHAFWIPSERFKRSAIPGRVNRFNLLFETAGHEEGLCSEFCGLRHSGMRFDVWVLSSGSYERWLTAHR
jgi:cytochrome c oxidase subunit II